MEVEFRANDIIEEVEPTLRHRDQLGAVQHALETDAGSVTNWPWSFGSVGQPIQERIQQLGWWNSIDRHLRSLDSLFSHETLLTRFQKSFSGKIECLHWNKLR